MEDTSVVEQPQQAATTKETAPKGGLWEAMGHAHTEEQWQGIAERVLSKGEDDGLCTVILECPHAAVVTHILRQAKPKDKVRLFNTTKVWVYRRISDAEAEESQAGLSDPLRVLQQMCLLGHARSGSNVCRRFEQACKALGDDVRLATLHKVQEEADEKRRGNHRPSSASRSQHKPSPLRSKKKASMTLEERAAARRKAEARKEEKRQRDRDLRRDMVGNSSSKKDEASSGKKKKKK